MEDFQRISRSTLNSGINPELLGPLTRMAYYKIREGMATLDQFIIHVKGIWKRKDLTPEELNMLDQAWKKGNTDVESGVKYADEVDDVPKNDNLGESSLKNLEDARLKSIQLSRMEFDAFGPEWNKINPHTGKEMFNPQTCSLS